MVPSADSAATSPQKLEPTVTDRRKNRLAPYLVELQLGARQCGTRDCGQRRRIEAERGDCAGDDRATPISDLDVPYPEGATWDGIIVLTLTAERDGTVSTVTPSPLREPFASLAVKAAQGWQFQPALRAGAAEPEVPPIDAE